LHGDDLSIGVFPVSQRPVEYTKSEQKDSPCREGHLGSEEPQRVRSEPVTTSESSS
jgi:hypothetical protein